jgi:hypothetical protein
VQNVANSDYDHGGTSMINMTLLTESTCNNTFLGARFKSALGEIQWKSGASDGDND